MELSSQKPPSWNRDSQLGDSKENTVSGKEYYLVNHFASIQRTYPAASGSNQTSLKDEPTSSSLMTSFQSTQLVSSVGTTYKNSSNGVSNLRSYDYIIEQSIFVAIIVSAILIYTFAVTLFFLNIAFLTVYFSMSWTIFINLAILFFPPLGVLFYPACFFLYSACAVFWCSVFALSVLLVNIGATSFYSELKDFIKCMVRLN